MLPKHLPPHIKEPGIPKDLRKTQGRGKIDTPFFGGGKKELINVLHNGRVDPVRRVNQDPNFFVLCPIFPLPRQPCTCTDEWERQLPNSRTSQRLSNAQRRP
jgi:hypothetical protein